LLLSHFFLSLTRKFSQSAPLSTLSCIGLKFETNIGNYKSIILNDHNNFRLSSGNQFEITQKWPLFFRKANKTANCVRRTWSGAALLKIYTVEPATVDNLENAYPLNGGLKDFEYFKQGRSFLEVSFFKSTY